MNRLNLVNKKGLTTTFTKLSLRCTYLQYMYSHCIQHIFYAYIKAYIISVSGNSLLLRRTVALHRYRNLLFPPITFTSKTSLDWGYPHQPDVGIPNSPINWPNILGQSTNDVTHLGGRGICQKLTLLHKPTYLVKWVTRGREWSKISKHGWRHLWRTPLVTPARN